MLDSTKQTIENLIDQLLLTNSANRPTTASQVSLFAQQILKINPILKLDAVTSQDIEEIYLKKYPLPNGSVIVADPTCPFPWITDFKLNNPMHFTNAYNQYLYSSGNSGNVAKIDAETDEIMNHLDLPTHGIPFDRRGLVIGKVQSGKTANFISLINKAADVGYKLIIVFSGMYNDLRRQTQMRIDRGFVGRDTGGEFGGIWKTLNHVHRNTGLAVNNLTSSRIDGDVDGNAVTISPYNPDALTIAVCKKNTCCLDALLKILYKFDTDNAGNPIVRNIPLLVIDDEADSASISGAYDSELPAGADQEFTKINGKIRCLLTMFEQSAYVGYTATPYANVMIDGTQDSDRTVDIVMPNAALVKFRLGEDLFPKTFIYHIEPSKTYMGAEAIFGEHKLPVHRPVDLVELRSWLGQIMTVTDIPQSLKDSVMSYLIATAIRRLRGDIGSHSSMLVHVHYRIDHMDEVALAVNKYVDELWNQLRIVTPTMCADELRMKYIYETDFQQTTNVLLTDEQKSIYGNVDLTYSWDDVFLEVLNVMDKLEVIAIHSNRNTSSPLLGRLDYDKYEGNADPALNGRYVIAIGGNCLSRGLTLEGLVSSYFWRTSPNYDTMMQMGRWFGYRNNYYDLCRVYLPQDTFSDFQSISSADETLRNDIKTLMRLPDATPRNFQLSVKCTPRLLITARKRMGAARQINTRDIDGIRSTDIIKLDIQSRIDREIAVIALINAIGRPNVPLQPQKNHFWWTNISSADVLSFIRAFKKIGEECPDVSLLDLFIEKENTRSHLTEWTVVLMNNTRRTCGSHNFVSGPLSCPLNLIQRRNDDPSTTVFRRERGIRQSSDESLDFTDAEIALMGDDHGLVVREKRPDTRGLLVIYPISLSENSSDIHYQEYQDHPLWGYVVCLPEHIVSHDLSIMINGRQA